MALEIAYAPGAASLEELRDAISDFLAEVAQGGGARREAEARGIDLDALDRLEPGAIAVRSEGKGLTGLELVVVTLVATKAIGLAEHVLTSLWDEVALPWLRDRLGVDALAEERERRE